MGLHISLTYKIDGNTIEVFSANITHNLSEMAAEAGIYNCLWRPEEADVAQAWELVQPLSHGLAMMKVNPDKFKAMDSPNGWGTYQDFVPWVEKVLAACQKFPNAMVSASR